MYDEIFESLFEIVTYLNRPKQDKLLLKRAGVELDTALFPIIMRVGLQQKIGLVELADQLGRDHSTVSRQVDKLEADSLVLSAAPAADRRVREIRLSDRGKAMAEKLVDARRILMSEALAGWAEEDLLELHDSLQRLARSLPVIGTGK